MTAGRLAAGILAVALVSAFSAWFALTLGAPRASRPAIDYHQWIHDQLLLTPAQETALAPAEERYLENRRHLLEVIRLANQDLGRAIRREKGYAPSVQAAVEEIHQAQGQLQRATLEHIFDMREALDPAQYDRLIDITVQGLSDNARTP